MPNLEIPRLHMKHLELVVRIKHPLPTAFAIRVKLFGVGNLVPFASVGALHDFLPNSVTDIVDTFRRRLHYRSLNTWIPIVYRFLDYLHPTRRSSGLP